jgi:hypothetical protein
MTTTSRSIAHRFVSAFNHRDVDDVLACFAADARYDDLFYGTFAGQAEIRGLFERMYAEGDRHQWTMTRVVVGPDCTIGEWSFTCTVSQAVRAGAGRTLTFTGVSVFDTSDGLCRHYREHFDRGAALFALGIRPAAVAAIVARRPTMELTAASPAVVSAKLGA